MAAAAADEDESAGWAGGAYKTPPTTLDPLRWARATYLQIGREGGK